MLEKLDSSTSLFNRNWKWTHPTFNICKSLSWGELFLLLATVQLGPEVFITSVLQHIFRTNLLAFALLVQTILVLLLINAWLIIPGIFFYLFIFIFFTLCPCKLKINSNGVTFSSAFLQDIIAPALLLNMEEWVKKSEAKGFSVLLAWRNMACAIFMPSHGCMDFLLVDLNNLCSISL